MDMTADFFGEHSFTKAAIPKLGPVPENFRIYQAGWLGEKPQDWDVMEVIGAEFRVAKSGKNKGQLCIMVPNTKRTVYVTKAEMRAIDEAASAAKGA